MKIFYLLLLINPLIAVSQLVPRDKDLHKTEIDKDIFRMMMTFTMDPALAFAGSYEHAIFRPFTVVIKAGPSLYWKEGIDDVWGNTVYTWYMKAVASGELRYYYNLKRRIRLEKTTRNFSAGYLSLEPFVESKSLIFGNKEEVESNLARSGVYINIGYQLQFRKGYFSAFFGTRFGGHIYSTSGDVFDLIHGGLTVGRVLYW